MSQIPHPALNRCYFTSKNQTIPLVPNVPVSHNYDFQGKVLWNMLKCQPGFFQYGCTSLFEGNQRDPAFKGKVAVPEQVKGGFWII